MPGPLPLKALNHIARVTRDVERSRAFYRDVLGFREVARPNFSFAGAWLHGCGFTIHLIHGDAVPELSDQIQTRGNHVALHTDDLDTVERLLTDHGIAFRKNEIPDRGIRQIFFQDPDGHHIEVGTYPAKEEFL